MPGPAIEPGLPFFNGWRPFWQRNGGRAENETEPGTYFVELKPEDSPHTEAQKETITESWCIADTQPLTKSDISQLTALQLVTHSRTEKTENDALAGSGTWFQLAILNKNGNGIKELPNGQSLRWLSHSNWYAINNIAANDDDGDGEDNDNAANNNEWCRGRMFTKDDEIFKYLKPDDKISVWMSAGPKHKNHADQAYLVFGFGCGPRVYQTPKLRKTAENAPVISVYGQARQECLMTPVDGSPTEIKANIVHGGVDLMRRLLDTKDNDWRVERHSLGPDVQATAASPNFDSFIELGPGKKGAVPPTRVVKEHTIEGPRQNAPYSDAQVSEDESIDERGSDFSISSNNAPQPPTPKIMVWDDSGVKKADVGIEVLDINSKVLIYQMHAPLWSGKLWNKAIENAQRNGLSILIVIDADDLRASGIRISRGISWEKTMEDLAARLGRITEKMSEDVQKKVHLLVRCGYEGVLHVLPHPQLAQDQPAQSQVVQNQPAQNPPPRYTRPFVFHMVPNLAEGDVLRSYRGRMSGIHLAFVTGLAASLARQPLPTRPLGRTQIGLAIKHAIIWSHRFAATGFCKDGNGGFNYPAAKDINTFRTSKIKVIYGDQSKIGDDGKWSLFSLLEEKRDSVAAEVVKLGTERLEASVPTAKFGLIQTADRTEIEGYRSTAAVVHEYLNSKVKKPLSIAVFGQPGAGKSFGVKEVIKAVLRDCGQEECRPIEANLSQFLQYSDLVGVFHKIRDTSLKGEIPVVLFDEFDSGFNGPLGWLKYFLAPMQDGEFLESGSVRPLGRSIFIFIGGTSKTFQDFKDGTDEHVADGGVQAAITLENSISRIIRGVIAGDSDDRERANKEREHERERKRKLQDKQAKKPDFVSRLSAHIDVRGPNQSENPNDGDIMFGMRRAMILQGQLQKHFGARVQDIQVDKTVLNALLKHTKFPNGTRSIELILQTSRLSGRRKFDSSALASDDQLSMHVGKVKEFQGLLDEEIKMEDVRPVDIDLYNKFMWARMKKDRD